MLKQAPIRQLPGNSPACQGVNRRSCDRDSEPEVVPNPLIGGTTTYSGKVFAGYNAKVSGDGTATDSASAVLNVNYATGELIVEPDEDALAAINSDVNGGGKQFLTVEAK